MTPIVKVYPADLGGCGYYRITWPARALQAQGHESVDVVMPDEPEERQIQAQWLRRDGGHDELLGVAPMDADVVVLQRPLTDTLAQAVPMLQRQGIKVVVEIDDDFEAISRRNVSWSHVQPHLHPRRNKAWLAAACAQADLVVCSTLALAERYGSHGRVRVVRNRVPAAYLDIERPTIDAPASIGWSGSTETHPDDLQVTGGGVARAVRATGATFAVVGTGRGVRQRLGLAEHPVACGWQPIEHYPIAMAQFDVGIVPLELTAFNAAKSSLKMMEMAALGVVPVVSPTPENLRLWGEAVGIVADSPRRWEGILKRLVRDDDYRTELAERSRGVMRRHTIEGNADEWLAAWTAPLSAGKVRTA